MRKTRLQLEGKGEETETTQFGKSLRNEEKTSRSDLSLYRGKRAKRGKIKKEKLSAQKRGGAQGEKEKLAGIFSRNRGWEKTAYRPT